MRGENEREVCSFRFPPFFRSVYGRGRIRIALIALYVMDASKSRVV